MNRNDIYTEDLMFVFEKGHIACSDVEELAGELVDGELPQSLAARLADHAKDCEPCAQFLGEYRAVISAAKSLRDSGSVLLGESQYNAPMPAAVRNRLHRALNEKLGLSLSVNE